MRPRERRYWMHFIAIIAALYAGICVLAWLVADSMMFFPNYASRSEPSGTRRLTLESGAQVSAVFLPNSDAEFILWYFHGNAESLGDIGERLQDFQSLGFSVFAVEYPGYGTSDGRPTESQVYSTLPAGLSYLQSELSVPPEKLIVYGRSIGGGPAVELARRQKVAGLILESAFVSAYRVMTRWPLLLGDKFNNLKKIAEITCPVLVIHGRDDHVIPFHHGEALFAAAQTEQKYHLWVDLGGHNDLLQWAGKSHPQAIVDFAKNLPRPNR